MKTILKWIAPRVHVPEGQLMIGALYGMLELYGYKQTAVAIFKTVKGVRKNGRHKGL